jgi:Cys-tRNA(Pro)/Cys-tRNA(Cys) deacylase
MTPFQRLEGILKKSGIPFVIHVHESMHTVEEMARYPHFVMTRIVKTVAFRIRNGGIVLAAVPGCSRVDYPWLATLLGVNRRDLASLSPEEVQKLVGTKPGGVSPVPLSINVKVLIDEDVLTILPTLFCGIGATDRTLEIAPADLLHLTGGQVGSFSKC